MPAEAGQGGRGAGGAEPFTEEVPGEGDYEEGAYAGVEHKDIPEVLPEAEEGRDVQLEAEGPGEEPPSTPVTVTLPILFLVRVMFYPPLLLQGPPPHHVIF